MFRPFVSYFVWLCDRSAFLSPPWTRSMAFPVVSVLRSWLVQTLFCWAFFTDLRRIIRFFTPFLDGCTVSSTPIARFRSFAHLLRSYARLRSSALIPLLSGVSVHPHNCLHLRLHLVTRDLHISFVWTRPYNPTVDPGISSKSFFMPLLLFEGYVWLNISYLSFY